ncbi:MAG: hypothetical protein IJD39_07600 [Clostridia bacterium]|nr:hypothetical protein [Clostridia bacterium]
MNDVNRGALRGIALSLSSMRDAIEAMCLSEWIKEDGYDSPPLSNRFSTTSTELEEAAIFVNKAIKIIQSISNKPADFEDRIGERVVPEDIDCIVDYGDTESRW